MKAREEEVKDNRRLSEVRLYYGVVSVGALCMCVCSYFVAVSDKSTGHLIGVLRVLVHKPAP